MTPEIPILMIALQVPVTPETRAEDILEALGAQLAAAIEAIQKQREEEDQDETMDGDLEPTPEEIEAAVFRASVLRETDESYNDQTRTDLLAQLGYNR